MVLQSDKLGSVISERGPFARVKGAKQGRKFASAKMQGLLVTFSGGTHVSCRFHVCTVVLWSHISSNS